MSIWTAARAFGGSLLAILTIFGLGPVSASAWEVLTTPNPSLAKASRLYGVSCENQENCMAVGNYVNSSGVQETLSERMKSGSWSIIYPKNPVGTQPVLYNDSCPTTEFCMAVGSFLKSPGEHQALAERLKGGVWELQTLPMPAEEKLSELGMVSCPNTEECVADGDYHDSAGQHFLVERWTSTGGGTWSVMTPAAPPSATNPGLVSIDCPGVKECMAVGVYTKEGVVLSVADEWKSSVWTIRSTVNPTGDTQFYPTSTFCKSLERCLMVGYYTNSLGAIVTLGEEWAGAIPAWSMLSTLNSTNPTNRLYGVACPSSFKVCYAVGESVKGAVTENLAEQFAGSTWSLTSIPAPAAATSSVLNRVDCGTEPNNCVTVGSYVNSSGVTLTLADRN